MGQTVLSGATGRDVLRHRVSACVWALVSPRLWADPGLQPWAEPQRFSVPPRGAPAHRPAPCLSHDALLGSDSRRRRPLSSLPDRPRQSSSSLPPPPTPASACRAQSRPPPHRPPAGLRGDRDQPLSLLAPTTHLALRCRAHCERGLGGLQKDTSLPWGPRSSMSGFPRVFGEKERGGSGSEGEASGKDTAGLCKPQGRGEHGLGAGASSKPGAPLRWPPSRLAPRRNRARGPRGLQWGKEGVCASS